MGYKASMYNILLEKDDNKAVVYNTFSGALAIFNIKDYDLLCTNTASSDAMISSLLAQGFLVFDAVDEYNNYSMARREYIFGEPKELGFVIAPTMRCNLKCIYCFEHTKGVSRLIDCDMDEENMMRTISFIEKQINRHKNIESLYIKWFGGEPLLRLDLIQHISYALINLCNTKGLKYSSFMITNGTLLNSNNVDILSKECRINKIQVTIDGSEYFYQIYKKASAEQYRQLLANISLAARIFPVDVRLNVSRENQGEMISVYSDILDISSYSSRVNVYAAPITECCDKFCHSMTQKEFEQFRQIFDRHVKQNNTMNGSIYILQTRKAVSCGSMRKDFCAIGPDGNFYRCEHEIGKLTEVIGDVRHGFYRNDADLKLLNYKLESKCASCAVLPFCAGGCPIQSVIYGNSIDCETMTDRVIDKLKNEVLSKYRKHINGDVDYEDS